MWVDIRNLLSGKTVRRLDLALAIWIAIWFAMGAFVAVEVRGLRSLSDTVVTAGQALQDTSQTLRSLDAIPLVGGRIGDVAQRAEDAARSAQASGRSSRHDIDVVAILLGVSVALVPTLPLLALYGPFRLGRARDVKTVRRGLARSADDPVFREFLARRATERLPYHRLREVTENPWQDVQDGRFDALARLELERLGIPTAALTGSRSPMGAGRG